MRSTDLFATAQRGLTANKTRSALTMLGIIIGVASVVLMLSIGRSFQGYILGLIESIGTNTLEVIPTGFQKFGGNLDTLKFEDYQDVRHLSTVESVAPVIIVAQQVHYGKEEVNPLVFGSLPTIFPNYALKLAEGRFLDDADDSGAKSVAVVSGKTATDLFGDQDPLGRRIDIGGFSFTVVGVLQSQGSLLLSDLDKPVYIPFSTARAITGQKYLSYMTMRSIGDPVLAKQDVTELLRQRHHIKNPEDDPARDDFIARSAEQVTSIVSSVTLGLTIFLALVAAISLLVGGIGIMNIMLVSVTERTREIGLRKAVGARKQDILLQFLLEAVALTFTGGAVGIIIGITVGWGLIALASLALGAVAFSLSIWAIVLAVGMAVFTGLVFGLYPARKASNLSPMEALRYE